MARRGCGRAWNQHGLPHPCACGCGRAVGPAGRVRDRLHRCEMAGRGLSLLYRPDDVVLAADQFERAGRAVSLSRVFWQGALTDVLNPKVAMFFLAFLPQFVDADAPHKPLAFLMLGLIFIFKGTLWCLGVAIMTARAAGRVRNSGRAMAWINRSLGALFVYLGVRIAFAQAK